MTGIYRHRLLAAVKPKTLLLLAGAILMSACGGGGGGNNTTPTRSQPTTPTTPTTPTNQQPTANAGTGATVEFGATVTLDGTGSSDTGGSIASYSWEQIAPESPTISLTNDDGSRATFTAPAVTQDTEFEFRLTVTDGGGLTATATVKITVSNAPPRANPGTDQTAKPNAEVTLDGSGSNDPGGGTIASYQWTQVEPGETTLEITGADTVEATFTAPDVEGSTAFKFQLEVTDERGLTHTREVTVTVSNTLPTATVTDVGTVRSSTVTTLDGSSSRAFQDRTITYQWTQVATEGAPTVTITDADKPMASFTVPAVDKDTTLKFRLTVTDSEGETDFVEVSIEVSNTAPIAMASTEQDTVDPNATVTLDGTNSTAAEGRTIRTYEWTQLSPASPAISIANKDKDTATFTAPVVGEKTAFEFQLEVTDSAGLTNTATATVTVSNTAPVAMATSRTLTVLPNAMVTLDGSGSMDPGGTIASYAWTQQSPNTPRLTLTGATTDTASFTAPTVTTNTDFVFQLTVTDRNVPPAMHAATVTIKVHLAPTATARASSPTVEAGAMMVRLTGTGMDPGNDRETIRYSWRQTDGPDVTLSAANIANPTFDAPALMVDTTVTFELTVMDEDGATFETSVSVMVESVPISPTRSASVNDDGDLAVTGDVDGNVRLWNLDTRSEITFGPGAQERSLGSHHGPVYAVAMSGDGTRAISGGHDGTVKLWNTEAGTAGYGEEIMFGSSPNKRSLKDGGIWVYTVALNKAGTRAASGGFDGKVRLWNTSGDTVDAVANVSAQALSGTEIIFSDDSLGSHGTPFTDDFATPNKTTDDTTGTTFHSVYAVALSDDGNHVLSGGADGAVHVWNVADGMKTNLADDDGAALGPVYGVDLSSNGAIAAAGGADNKVRVWRVNDGMTLGEFDTPTADVSSVALSTGSTGSNNIRVISVGGDGYVRFWNVDTDAVIFARRHHTDYVWSVALSSNGQVALSVGADRALNLWDTGNPLATAGTFNTDEPDIIDLSTPDDVVLREITANYSDAQRVRSVALSGDGRFAMSGGHDAAARLWDVAARTEQAVIGDTLLGGAGTNVFAVALNGNGHVAMAMGGSANIYFWNTAVDEPSGVVTPIGTTGNNGGVGLQVALTADGRLGISGGESNEGKIWDVDAVNVLHRTPQHSNNYRNGHTQEVAAVGLSADGTRALSVGHCAGGGDEADCTVRFWEVAPTFRQAGVLRFHGSGRQLPLDTASMSADGGRALLGSSTISARGNMLFIDTAAMPADFTDPTSDDGLLTTMRHPTGANSVALNADGRLALSGSGSTEFITSPGMESEDDTADAGTVRLWDPTTGSLLRVLDGPSKQVEAVALSADGRVALSGGRDTNLHLWHLGGTRTIRPPFVTTANAGSDQPNVVQGSTVTLTGSDSDDTSGKDLLAYYWQQTVGDAVMLSPNNNTATVTFTAPSEAATLTFVLTVTDAQGLIATDEVTVTVAP